MRPEQKKEIDKITNVEREADTEKSPIIINKIKKNAKTKYIQYKITIPKKFIDKIKIDPEKQQFIFYLLNKGTPKNPEYELTAKLENK
jgi:hypothetical protein